MPCIVGMWRHFLQVAGPPAIAGHWRHLVACYAAYSQWTGVRLVKPRCHSTSAGQETSERPIGGPQSTPATTPSLSIARGNNKGEWFVPRPPVFQDKVVVLERK